MKIIATTLCAILNGCISGQEKSQTTSISTGREAISRDTTNSMKKIEELFQSNNETEILIGIGEIIWSKVPSDDDSLVLINEAQRTFLYIDMLEGQVNNGGFDQFFFNSSGDYVYEILNACKKIHAYKTAKLLEQAISIFPKLPIPRDTETRRSYMRDLDEHISAEWRALDDRFYEYEDNIAQLQLSFVKENLEEICK